MAAKIIYFIVATGITFNLLPTKSWACACGCAIFDVGTSSMMPARSGNMLFLEYDDLSQNQNWHSTSASMASQNPDKKIESRFLTVGDQYMFNRKWGAQIEVPITFRKFETTNPESGLLDSNSHTALGDIRLQGLYTGFSDDMSTGITYGLKLATGDDNYSGFDPDTQIGSGSTDALLGVFHVHPLTADNQWDGFAQASIDVPLFGHNGYYPGNELDGAIGVYYNGLTFARQQKLAPVLQLLGAARASDHGPSADPENTGYDRLFISPAVEYDLRSWRLYADIEFPFYQYMNGNQLVASNTLKLRVGYTF